MIPFLVAYFEKLLAVVLHSGNPKLQRTLYIAAVTLPCLWWTTAGYRLKVWAMSCKHLCYLFNWRSGTCRHNINHLFSSPYEMNWSFCLHLSVWWGPCRNMMQLMFAGLLVWKQLYSCLSHGVLKSPYTGCQFLLSFSTFIIHFSVSFIFQRVCCSFWK